MELEKLISAIEVIERREEIIKPITGLAYHSGRVKSGSLFVCIKGYKTDGHLYLKQAVENGAVAAVVEQFQDDIKVPQYRVNDSRSALAALADIFYGHPSRQLKLTGITATNGKTTTTYMAHTILEAHGIKTGMIGTVIYKTGSKILASDLTTPESLDLHAYFREMVDNGLTHAVMEVSSSGLELKRVGSVAFDIVVVNNISREHIDLHGSFENYFKAKASLARNAGAHQWAVFNMDCPYSAALSRETKAHVFTYGLKNKEADCIVEDLDLSTGRARFNVVLKNKAVAEQFALQPDSFLIELPVLGLHSVYNAMAAILVGLLHGIPAATIQKALHEFRGVERRFELIFEDQYKVIDDHFANAGNINVTLETLQMMDYKKLVLVYAIRGSRGVTVNRENAEAIAAWAPKLGLEKVLATTSTDYVGEKDYVTPEECQVFKEIMASAGLKAEIHELLSEAIAGGLAEAGQDDVILLAGCQGMDYGASVCLEQISKLRPDLPQDRVFAALKNRVAGV